MFQCCPGCTEPEGEQSVWRYMDLPKYIDLLARRKLFFARVGLMEDKFEGGTPTATGQLTTKSLR